MEIVTAINRAEGLKTEINTKDHHFIVDEPIDIGGTHEGPNPYELLASSLASCTAITLRMYIRHKQLPIDNIQVDVDIHHETVFPTTRLTRKIHYEGTVDHSVKQRLISVANSCPIHKILNGNIQINTEFYQ